VHNDVRGSLLNIKFLPLSETCFVYIIRDLRLSSGSRGNEAGTER
jgi:hypothetical protein